ncbi:gamma-glutamyltransferase family protein [Acidihalobacter ferrooxydans]|uniref:Gamma-glutamyltransferase n=1 Tax=Acidihalobacter ferrooxydans TaxID=1765967 RepID=A0A1P8UK36_9GAMM|nr:gamma-glutamyltransferase family protein [Acidihalobacter ferrooxydans]APZ44185.1 gamma-glutamyltransferase [Acidihalobacter ferrooxydans]
MATLQAESERGAVTAPHARAAEAGRDVLRRGGNALEAAVAMASTIAVVYPHMNSLGGDAFWLIADADGTLRGIDAAGQAGRAYTPALYAAPGCVPERGGLATVTVGGAVGAWQAAYDFSRAQWGGAMTWHALLAAAQTYAADGCPVSASYARTLDALPQHVRELPGFAATYLPDGCVPAVGEMFRQPALARTLSELQAAGAEGFYRGALAQRLVAGLRAAGSLLDPDDLAAYRPRWVEPLRLPYGRGELANMPPPSQGFASMMIAAVLQRYGLAGFDPMGADYVHAVVEATKAVFAYRDRYLCDPDVALVPLEPLFAKEFLDELAAGIDPLRAAAPGQPPAPGDTVWFGAVDEAGRAVSVIQSIYHEFGSGVVAGDTGVVWNNRGCAFSLDSQHPNVLAPGKRPMHTLNPAMYLEDGRVRLVYGTMGGDGQPQTQAAILTRVLEFGLSPAAAIAAPRWVYGRTWGESSAGLRLEKRFDRAVFDALARRGHAVSWVPRFSDFMGHAGMLRLNREAGRLRLEAAADPRSDGAALGV